MPENNSSTFVFGNSVIKKEVHYLPAISFKTFDSCGVIDCFFVWISQYYTNTQKHNSNCLVEELVEARLSRQMASGK